MRQRQLLFLCVLLSMYMISCLPVGQDFPISEEGLPLEPRRNLEYADMPVGTVILTEHGSRTWLGYDGMRQKWFYSGSVGETNTWNGTDYVRYIYDLENKRVQIGKLIFSHGPNGVISVNHTGSDFLIGAIKWYAQYYLSDTWQNFTFDNYEYLGATQTDDSATVKQRWWSTNGELNVSYTYYYWNELKMRAQATNWAAQTVPVRVIWACNQIKTSGVGYSLVKDENDVSIGVQVGNQQQIFWSDVVSTMPDINVNPVLDKVNNKCGIVFGNQSSILAQYETMDIDPTYTVASDDDDSMWWTQPGSWTEATGNSHDMVRNETSQPYVSMGYFRYQVAIPKDATITEANVSWWVFDAPSTSSDHPVRRIDETSVAIIEGRGNGNYPNVTHTNEETLVSGTTNHVWKTATAITDMLQDQVNLAGWTDSSYFGVGVIGDESDYTELEDYQHSSWSNHSYINATYETEDEYDYVDQISTEDAQADIGTHSSFAAQQAGPDQTNDTMTEANTGGDGQNLHDFVDQLSTEHLATPDKGTHSVFSDLQDYGSNYDQMQEAQQGTGNDYSDWSQSDATNVDSVDDVGTQGTYANIQDLGDSDYMTVQEANVGSATQVAFAAAGTGVGVTNTAQMYPTYPASPQSGDLFLCHIYILDGTTTVTSVTGFTALLGPYTMAGSTDRVWLYYAYSDGSETGNTTVVMSTSTNIGRFSRIYSFRNVHQTIGSAYENVTWYDMGVGATVYDQAVETTGTLELALNIVAVAEDGNLYTDFTGETGGDWAEVVAEFTSPAGLDGALVVQAATMASAGTVDGGSYSQGGSNDDVGIIGMALKPATTTDYELNFEYQWTDANYSETNEEVCINVQTAAQTASETLKIWEWTGSAWAQMGDSLVDANGWNNFTAAYITSSTYYIKLNDSLQSNEAAQDTWSIDSIILHTWSAAVDDYELDLEVGWTALDYDNAYEFLCIYPVTGGGWPSEDIKVDIWDGSWTNLFSDLTPDQWNNISISSYLGAATEEIRFLGGTEDGDSTQSTWEIDAVLIRTLNDVANYSLDLEEQWTDANYSRTNEYLCIFAGPTDAEDIKVDVWTDPTWTNVISDLTANQWNNVSVSSYLTAAKFTIRFVDGDSTNDTNQDAWEKDCTILWTYEVSDTETPTNDETPSLKNPDDSTFMYARYKEYTITTNSSDGDGYDSIDTVLLLLWDDTPSTNEWTAKYDEDTDTFSELNGTTKIALNVGSSSATRSGNYVNLTWVLEIEWIHSDLTDVDVQQFTNDTGDRSDIDSYEVNWDVETRLDYSIAPAVTDDDAGTVDRGDLDEAYTFEGTLIYYTSTDDNPPSDEVDVWLSQSAYGTNVGPWSDLTLTSGAFSITGYGDDVVAQTTATVKPVAEGDGSGGTSLYYTTDLTDTYIVDQIIVLGYMINTTDNRNNINTVYNVSIWFQYDYDDTNVTTGTHTLNAEALTYSPAGNGNWTLTKTQGTVGDVTYNTLAVGGDDTHGITGESQNGKSQVLIWDQLVVLGYMTNSTDNHDNINDGVNISVWIQYDYDNTNVTDGTITINSDSYTYSAGGNWTFEDTESTATSTTWDTAVASGNTEGITSVNQNGKSQNFKWDSLTISVAGPTDGRQNINANASGIVFSAVYDLGGDYDGTFTLNSSDFDGDGTVVLWGYTVSAANGDDTYGITEISSNDETSMIWDQVIVLGYMTNSTDNHDNINDGVNISVWIQYDYDDTNVTDGTIVINSDSYSYSAGGNWTYEDTEATATSTTWDTAVAAGNTHGITSVNQNGKSQNFKWDSLTISVAGPTDGRQNVGANASGIVFSAVYVLGGSYDGTFTLNNSDFDGDGTVVLWGYNVSAANGDDTYAITAITTYDATSMIWDRIIILTTTTDDGRIDISTAAALGVTAQLEYDSHSLGSGDTLYMNDTSMSWNTTHFTLAPNFAAVGIWNFFVNSSSANEATHGITLVNLDSNNVNQIWDRIKILTTTTQDGRIDISTAADIRVTAELEYDSHALGAADTLYMNDTSMSWVSTYFRLQPNFAAIDQWLFFVNSSNANEVTYGITVINLNGQNVNQIWDQLIVLGYMTNSTDNHDNINDGVNISVWIQYDYDDTNVTDGTITINSDSYSYSEGGNWTYEDTEAAATSTTWDTAVAAGNTHGITSVNQNGKSQNFKWDSLTISVVGPTDGRQNLNANASGIVFSAVYDLGGDYDGTFTLNSTDFDGDGTVVLWGYTVSTANGDDSYAITEISSNDETSMIWDRIKILTTTTDDGRIDISTAAALAVTAELEYDSHALGSGDTLYMNDTSMSWNTTHFTLSPNFAVVGLWNFFVNSSSANEATYGITLINLDSNDVDQIWDRIEFITSGVVDGRIDANTEGSVYWTARYDYDDVAITSGMTANLNTSKLLVWNTISSYWDYNETKGTTQLVGYQIDTATETGYGLSAFVQTAANRLIIWDRIIITLAVDDTTPKNGVKVFFNATSGTTLTYEYDSATVTTYIMQINRNNSNWYTFTDSNLTLFNDTNTNAIYGYNATATGDGVSESTYGLTTFTTNTVTVTWANIVPVNESTAPPTLQNPDDADNIYAKYKFYLITTNHTDEDGFLDIDTILLLLWDDGRSTNYWTLKFDEDTDTFSVFNGSSIITLTYATNVSSGNWINITWSIKIDWDHADLTDIDMKLFVNDTLDTSDVDWYESDWDTETRLDYSTSPTVDDNTGTIDRGDLDGTFYTSGVVIFYTSGDNYPLANETDVEITMDEYGTSTGPWSGNVDGSGEFNITCYGDDAVGQDTVTIKVFEQGGAVDLYYTTSITDTYISDQIQVQSYWYADNRINVDATAQLSVLLYYSHDSAQVTTGTITINALSGSHFGTGNWNFTDSKATVQGVTYNTVAATGDDTHGLTSVDQNSQSELQIWDQIIVLGYNTNSTDNRDDIDDYFNVSVWIQYDYDNTNVTDGTVTINGESAAYDVGGNWSVAVTSATVAQTVYNTIVAASNTHGITDVNQNSKSQTVTWDRIQVQSYSASDTRDNVNDNVDIDVTLWYDYDDTLVTTGTITINGFAAAHQGSGVWRITRTSGSVTAVTYNTVATSANAYSLTEVDQNGQSQQVIWDQLLVLGYITNSTDNRDNVDDYFNISIWIQYDYDDTNVTDGTITVNGNSTTYKPGGNWTWTITFAAVGDATFDTAVAAGNTHGITSVNQDSKSVIVIWDRIEWYVSGVDDGRIDTDANGKNYWSARYDYNNTEIAVDIITAELNGSKSLTWNNTHWIYTESKGSVQLVGYGIDSASESYHGLSVWTQTASNTSIIWDRIKILTTTTDDGRIDYNTAAALAVTAELEYDSHSLGSGDTLYMNDTSMSWNTTHFTLSPQFAAVDQWLFFVNSSSANEATYGITVVNLDSNNVNQIWDRIIILTTTTDDGRIDISTAAALAVTAELEYDSHALGSGDTLYMNDTSMSWNTTHFTLAPNFAAVDQWLFYVNSSSANEATYGITVINLDSNQVNQIWDRIEIVTTAATDGRIDYGTSTTINVTAQLEYDSHTLGAADTLYMNDTSMTWDTDHYYLTTGSYSFVLSYLYFVNSSSANEVTYGITVVNLNGQSATVIWDRIKVMGYSTNSTDNRDNINDGFNVTVWLQYEFDSTNVTDGTVTINSESASYVGAGNWSITKTQGTVGDFTCDTVVASGNTHGITVVNQNGKSQLIIWDLIIVLGYITNSTDNRDDIDDYFNITVWLQYDYDNTNLTDGSVTINAIGSSYVGAGNWSINVTSASVQAITYNTVAISGTNNYDITSVNQNSKSRQVIWDRIEFITSGVIDGRIDMSTEGSTYWVIRYDYDDVNITSGVTSDLNGSKTLTWNSISEYWEYNETKGIVQLVGYGIDSASESGYGLTIWTQTASNTSIIWDRITILTTTSDDDRINYNTAAALAVTAQLEYDSHSLGSGDSLYMNDTLMTWNGTHFTLAPQFAAIDQWLFFVNSSSANEATYGITLIDLNGQNQNQIWDRIKILTTVATDGRIDYGTSTTINVTAELEYDNHALGAADTLYMNDTSMTWDTNHFYLTTGGYSIVDLINYFVNSSNANEATYGITVIDLNGQDDDVIWDRILILTTTATDGRIDYGTSTTINVTAELEYDNHALGASDTLYMNDTQMTWDTDHYYLTTGSYDIVGLINYYVNSSNANEATYGITVINLDSNDADVIWDRIVFTISGVVDGRIDYNTEGSTYWVVQYDYDDSNITSGVLTAELNGSKSLTWNTVTEVWEYNETKAAVQLVGYGINSASESTYDLTIWTQSAGNTSIIWDRIQILTTVATDWHIDYGTSTTINVTAQLEYDSHALDTSDTLYMNDTSMTWDTDHFYLTAGPYSIVERIDYFVNSSSANENDYGITVVDLDGKATYVIWDRIVITIVASETVPINDTVVYFNATTGTTIQYAYNSSDVATFTIPIQRNLTAWYVFTNANLTLFNDTGADVKYNYTAVASVSGGDLTAFTTNLVTVTWSAAANNDPVNETTPTLQNPDDSTFMYARYRYYLITSNSSDADGGDSIHMVMIMLWDNGQSTNYWTVSFDVQTDTFSIVNGSANIAIAACENVTSGNWVNITWYIKIDWDHTSLTDVDIKMFTNDTAAADDQDFYEVNWDVEARVDYTTAPNVDDNTGTIDRGDFDGTYYTSGVVIYYGSGADYVPANETDVWVSVSQYGTNVGPWSGDVDGSGEFNITSYADDAAGQDTITVKVVEQGEGSGGTDLYYTTSATDTYITDRIVVQGYVTNSTDNRDDINAGFNVTVWLQYEYDTTNVTAGTITVNSNSTSYVGAGNWSLQYEFASVGDAIWNTVVASGDDTHGLTEVNQNGKSVTTIWDRIEFLTSGVVDGRIDYGTEGSTYWVVRYDYDNTNITSGLTSDLNGSKTLTWNTVTEVWEYNETKSSVMYVGYGVDTASESGYGLTAWTQTDSNTTIIWDRIQITVTAVDDGRIDYNTQAEIYVSAELEYDAHALGSGDSLYMNDTLMTWNGTYFKHQPTFTAVDLWNFFVNSSSASEVTYGITVVNLDSNDVDVIWDRIKILTTTSDDGRIDINTQAALGVTAELEYDSHALGSGDTLYMNDTIMGWNTTHFTFTPQFNAIGLWNFYINSSNANEVTHGITVINLDGKSVNQIWDRIKILTTAATDGRIDYGTSTTINVTAELEYDNHALGSGDSLYMNNTLMTWNSDHFYLTTGSYSIVDLINYFVNSSNADEVTYGISVVNLDSNNADVIWDRIKILTTTSDDGRIDINTVAALAVTAELEYDSHALGSGDSLYMNDTSMSWNTTHFTYAPQFNAVGQWNFFVNSSSASEVTYGITVVNLDSKNVNQIWDRIKILTTVSTDWHIDYGTSTTINVTAELEYDNHVIGSGDTLYMNDTSMTFDTDHFYLTTGSYSIVDRIDYYVNSSSANEDTYGITVINLDGKASYVIWDRIVINIVVDDSTPLNDVKVFFNATTGTTITYAYNSSAVGTYTIPIQRNLTDWYVFTNANLTLFNDTNSDAIYNYTAVASVSGGDLTAFTTNLVTVTWSAAPNQDPVNQTGAVLTNPDDSTFMYARYTFYLVTTNHSDADGYSDIHMILLLLYDNGQTTNYWTLKYLEDSNVFSIVNGSTSVALTDSTVVRSGDWVNITWRIKIAWAHTDLTDVDTKSYINDSVSNDDVDWYESDWDVETRTDYSVAFNTDDNTGTTDRGDIDGTFYGSGTIIYYGSGDNYPLDNETDIWVASTDYGAQSGPWSDTTYSSGAFNVTCYADDIVGQDTYWVYPVAEGAGSGGTKLNQSSESDTYIADRIEFLTSGIVDGRIDTATEGSIYWVVQYDYDNTNITSGLTANLNDTKTLVWNSISSYWDYNETKITVQLVGYGVNDATEGTNGHGLSNWTQTASNRSIIWDRIEFYTSGVVDGRIDNGTEGSTYWVARYDYDDVNITSGILTSDLNGSKTLVWNAISEYWDYNETKIVIGLVGYGVSSASESTYGLSNWTQTASNTSIIWDRIEFYDSGVVDGRLDISTEGETWWKARYDYDNVAITSGLTAALNSSKTLTWDGANSRWRYQETKGSVQHVGYGVESASESGYGLTVWTQTASNTTVIWDQIEFYASGVDDGRIDISTNGLTYWSARYDYDNVAITSGMTALLNGSKQLSWNGTHWIYQESKGSVQHVGYTIVSATETGYGLSGSPLQSAGDTTIIWDSLTITLTDPTDQRQNLNANASGMVGTAVYDYDGTSYDGTLTLNNTDYNGDGTAVKWGYTVDTASGDSYGITVISSNDETYHIWDSLTITAVGPTDQRININDNASGMAFSAIYDYDSTAYDGSLTLNDTTYQYATVGKRGYEVASASGDSYDITTISTNDETYCIWDSLTIVAYGPTDQRINIAANASGMVFNATYDYDSVLYDGTLNLNDTTYDYGTVGRRGYTISSAAGDDTYGITTISSNDETYCIWDQIIVMGYATNSTDNRDNVDDYFNVTVWLQYEYDSTNVTDGTVTINGDSASYVGAGNWSITPTSAIVGSNTYNNVQATGNTHGITAENQNGESIEVIWDRLVIDIQADDEVVDDNVQVNFTLIITYEYDSATCTTYTMQIDRNATNWYVFINANISLFNDTNTNTVYQYNASAAGEGVSETTYGLTVFTTNTETVQWVPNDAPVNSTVPIITNVDDTDNMYARYKFYEISTNSSDAQGFSDIDTVLLFLYNDTQTENYWTLMFNATAGTFSIVNGSDNLVLVGSTNSSSGNWVNITWRVKIAWNHTSISDTDVKQFTNDTQTATDTDWYEADWDIESRLDYTTASTISDDRGNVDSTDLVVEGGQIIYYGSGDNIPFNNETDIWIVHDRSGEWLGNLNATGYYNVTGIESGTEIRNNTFTIKIVANDTGSGDTDLYYDTSPEVWFISDRIIITLSATSESPTSGDTVTITLDMTYAYDSGTVANHTTAIWDDGMFLLYLYNTTSFDVQDADTHTYTIGAITELNYSITEFVVLGDGIRIQWTSPHPVGPPVEPTGPFIPIEIWIVSFVGFIGVVGASMFASRASEKYRRGGLKPTKPKGKPYHPGAKGGDGLLGWRKVLGGVGLIERSTRETARVASVAAREATRTQAQFNHKQRKEALERDIEERRKRQKDMREQREQERKQREKDRKRFEKERAKKKQKRKKSYY